MISNLTITSGILICRNNLEVWKQRKRQLLENFFRNSLSAKVAII